MSWVQSLKFLHPGEMKVKIQVKFTLEGHEGIKGEEKHISTLSLTSALDGGGWSR